MRHKQWTLLPRESLRITYIDAGSTQQPAAID
jgi:hypothetical protein